MNVRTSGRFTGLFGYDKAEWTGKSYDIGNLHGYEGNDLGLDLIRNGFMIRRELMRHFNGKNIREGESVSTMQP